VERRLPGNGAKNRGRWYGIECGAASHEDDENLAPDFHHGRVAMSVRDKFYLCAKITFSGFEDSSSK
jgi:hypothetical protein